MKQTVYKLNLELLKTKFQDQTKFSFYSPSPVGYRKQIPASFYVDEI
jgi:hypothetical protein